MDLSTTYLGLKLKNPIIVGASNLVTDLNFLKKLEEAGAAAIVYKSLFEEQIQLENLENYHAEEDYGTRHAEMGSMFPASEDAWSRRISVQSVKSQTDAENTSHSQP